MANIKTRPTGDETREADRKRLPDGKTNWSPSGALPDPVVREPGIVPLKAVNTIVYGAQQTALPGSIFVPVSAIERAFLLKGDFPPAEEASMAELSLFAEQQTELA